ncbi:hypothetical protein HNQ92_004505 [Rhabdobacter roseus]|uniref:Uncharacterized protein n=1 Tax=Rhabdobacter roseus TaxID=1655419 RepID=A0A840TTW4_9BACT|nr:hypothetical protein [Rhabdobacter roseus]
MQSLGSGEFALQTRTIGQLSIANANYQFQTQTSLSFNKESTDKFTRTLLPISNLLVNLRQVP